MLLNEWIFRVWSYDDKKFISPEGFRQGNKYVMLTQCGILNQVKEFVNVEIESGVSIFDKSGRQLYENDIVTLSSYENVFVGRVKLNTALGAYFEIMPDNVKDYSLKKYLTLYYTDNFDYKISKIGNIHENPELWDINLGIEPTNLVLYDIKDIEDMTSWVAIENITMVELSLKNIYAYSNGDIIQCMNDTAKALNVTLYEQPIKVYPDRKEKLYKIYIETNALQQIAQGSFTVRALVKGSNLVKKGVIVNIISNIPPHDYLQIFVNNDKVKSIKMFKK